ncbi:hypothetical protein MKW98_020667 [Papaver atlanticum]|uniref:X8 domain-containing protein n=1 Tax=Papaver atlanticum TaxID=357466 RepID=A0AAD4XWT6_9MAGN|nr:hypothetical protein MKW98_020667 [Papaver atlanticum]
MGSAKVNLYVLSLIIVTLSSTNVTADRFGGPQTSDISSIPDNMVQQTSRTLTTTADITNGPTFCIARDLADENKLQEALDWACSHGVSCSPLLQGQPCYEPNTVAAHASYAFNTYYHLSGRLTGTCDFRGLANITTTNPSHGACIFSDNKHIASPTSSGSKNAKHGGTGALLLILVSLILSK